ncbi:hypothetical protein MVEG_07778 [Podila verticillata NRRL 6337]|nr:hypothetical protein MVEG_07778 [Podila verticillata NRRL 6337]
MGTAAESKQERSWFDSRTSATSTESDTVIVGSLANIDFNPLDSAKHDQEKVFSDLNNPDIIDLRADREDGVSTFKACSSLVCVIAGTGTLGMPYAVAQSGWLGSVIIVLALLMSAYTGLVLIESLYLDSTKRRSSFQEIAQDAYGRIGHHLAYFVMAFGLFGVVVLYVILSSTLSQAMVRDRTENGTDVPVYVYVIGCSVFVWACLVLTKTMKEIALLSILGAVATIGVVLITAGVSFAEMAHRSAAVVGATHKLVDWSKFPVSLATISFAYGGNSVFPHVEGSMRYPRSWSRSLWMALWVCFALYSLIAVVGYHAFGHRTVSPILNNFPHGIWSILANTLITAHVLLAAPILMTSLSVMIETSIAQRWPAFEHGSTVQQFFKRAIPRTVSMLLVGLIASVVPFFGDMMDLLSSLTSCLSGFMMPIGFYYKLGGLKNSHRWEKLWVLFIMVVGTIATVMGTIDAVRHLAADFQK